MINFLAEIAERFETTILPTPSNRHHSTANNTVGGRGIIYEIDISAHPTSGYWLDWGGYFNDFVGTQIMLYYGGFLREANSMTDLRNTLDSLYIREDKTVFVHLPRHPWLFPDYSTSTEHVIPFLSNALNPDDPSNNIIRGTKAEVRLEVPNFTVKLSDNIAGMTLNQGFSITLKNSDGAFDDEHTMNIFNTPVYLRKTTVENPRYEDFRLIRDGLV